MEIEDSAITLAETDWIIAEATCVSLHNPKIRQIVIFLVTIVADTRASISVDE
jgi:hypothetical protein